MKPWLVVLAGGSGTRFWPRSRGQRPKQLLPIVGSDSLLVTTVKRFQSWIPLEQSVIITTKEQELPVKDAVRELKGVHVLAEPSARNTAPAILLCMEWIRARDPQALVIIVPADHWIPDIQEYIDTMKTAASVAMDKALLVTIGIQPTRPETGFGYIRSGESVGGGAFAVDRFVEKPSKEVAETMVQQAEYLWNAGMFVWTVPTFMSEMEKASPQIYHAFAPYRLSSLVKDLEDLYPKTEAISIDYALMEKSKRVAVVPGSTFGWNDLGSFVALGDVYPQTEGGVARADRVLAIDSVANIVDCPGKTVALLGVHDMIVIDTGDVLLVAAKEKAQDVKRFVDRLKQEGHKELL